MTGPANDKINLVHCTWATGVGAGAGRMDAYYFRFLDNKQFSIKFVSTREPGKDGPPYDLSIPVEHTGQLNRFEKLFEMFRHADIVQFQGSLDALSCEVARLACVPVVVEILHNIEAGGQYPNIDATVCVSNAVTQVQNPGCKVTTILNGIDLDQFPFDSSRRNPEKIVLLQVSNRQKSVFNIDEIAPQLLELDPRLEIWLAGPNQTRPSSERVKFFGIERDIHLLYQQADLMTLFSKLEPFGLVAIEAMACGCLPVVSNSGGFTEIVTNGETGWLVDPVTKDQAIATIAKIVSDYFTNPSGRQALELLRHKARETVEQRFDIRSCVAQYAQLYQRLIREKGRRTHTVDGIPNSTPEVEIGDAMFHSHHQAWDLFDKAMRNAAFHPDNFHNQATAELARIFAESCATRNQRETCLAIYRKIYRSGFHSPVLVEQWIQCLEFGFELEEIASACLYFANFVPMLVLNLAEKLVQANRVEDSISLLEKAMSRSSRSLESFSVYSSWLEKLKSL